VRRVIRGSLTLLVGLVLGLVVVGAALGADRTDTAFGTDGIAEIEARSGEQVGGIVDLARTGDGKLLAAIDPIANRGHYFAAARINAGGSLDQSFGEGGFTKYIDVWHRHGEVSGGALQAEAVAAGKGGDVVLAGYFASEGASSPALARFTAAGKLDPSFGQGGTVIPHPAYEGERIGLGETGGEELSDVAVAPDGTIVTAGEVIPGHSFDRHSPKRDAAVVTAYRPDGKVDRGFGHRGRFQVEAAHHGYTGFTRIVALPSGKLLVSGYVGNQLVLYRLTAAGRRDPSFGGGDGKVTVGKVPKEAPFGFPRAQLTVEKGGRILLCGAVFSDSILNGESIALLRLLPDGRRDPSFRHSIYIEKAPVDTKQPIPRKHVQLYAFEPQSIAVDGHGRIVVTGVEAAPYTRGQKESGYLIFAARRFLPSGRRDKGFGRGGVQVTNPPGAQSVARAAVTTGGGKVVAGGWVQLERGGGNGPGNTAMLLTRYR
jgi:uncharacterized delta-60 repeat protein